MRQTFLLFILLAIHLINEAQVRSINAVKIQDEPIIDGILDDACWNKASVETNFKQKTPYYNSSTARESCVRMLYNDEGVFFGIQCFDNAPDSILKQLGKRDDDLNADKFNIKIDPYNNRLDAYIFGVYASGIQSDSRIKDANYNAVWESATTINSNGWEIEVFIPYSAFSFPKNDVQTWAIQFERIVRRDRETSQWALEDQTAANALLSWGITKGIKGIKPSLKLSLTPYASYTVSHYPYKNKNTNDFSQNFGGGLDLRISLNESYNLDISLLPDFSQVQSDDIIKNLSAFETGYAEQRPFFKESMDLFQKGNFFYTRRIGREPRSFYEVYSNLDSNEVVIDNPAHAKLLNAVKIYGRNKNGLAIGVFNAITNNTYAEISNSSGENKKILTEPLANYNIIVVDKEFKNSASIYAINTSSLRNSIYLNNNVTSLGGNVYFNNKNHRISASIANSQNSNNVFSKQSINNSGFAFNASIAKVKGNWRWEIANSNSNSKFNYNDLGFMSINNFSNINSTTSYSWYNPAKWIKESQIIGYLYSNYRQTTLKPIGNYIRIYGRILTIKHFSLYAYAENSISKCYNYYEPRNKNYFYIEPLRKSFLIGFSSNYSKPFALDFEGFYSHIKKNKTNNFSIYLSPIYKLGNHISFKYEFNAKANINQIGYAGCDTLQNPLFGNRNVNEINNVFSLVYTIKNNMPISLRIRHYFNRGKYLQYMPLLSNGLTGTEINNNSYDYNYTFNNFYLDFIYSWQFAPGSLLNVIWKTQINPIHSDYNQMNYIKNLQYTIEHEQLNSITLKLVYYLDYNSIKKRKNI
ncbi:MAG: carbohydrate binding family 9 domain-containing protein [Bacteroidales bacterium]|nr:carbohydrate binding family 9 domain-containing protein [Bacteroidales bacterium]